MPALGQAAALRGASIAVACSCMGLGACGGASHRRTVVGKPALTETVVARVGRSEITLATVRHLMALHAQSLSAAVSRAIHAQWLIEEGREEGVRAGHGEIQREFEAGKRSLGSNAEFEAYLRRTGQSAADILTELRLGRLADGIFQNVRKRERPVTAAEVLAYYRAHPSQFHVPEQRDVRIVRTVAKASALRLRRQLEGRSSFAAAAHALSVTRQPLGAVHGEVAGLRPGVYQEKPLNDAIFTARLHVLYGPLQIGTPHEATALQAGAGWFLFEVIRRRPGRLEPAARVSRAIARRLSKARRDATLAGFIASFRRKWRARTSCAPGYVVSNCRQFVPRAGAREREDPYTL